MNLTDKLKENGKKYLGVGALASTVFLSGCETPSGDALFSSLIFRGAALNQNNSPQQSAAWSILGQTAETAAIVEGQKEAAREGKSQVNVNVHSPQTQVQESAREKTVDEKKIYSLPYLSSSEFERHVKKFKGAIYYRFKDYDRYAYSIETSNYVKDFNNDGIIAWTEFVGLEDTFSTEEKITIFFGFADMIFDNGYVIKSRAEMLNSAEKVISSKIKKFPKNDFAFEYEPGELKPGKYNALLYLQRENLQDKFLGNKEFEVVKEK